LNQKIGVVGIGLGPVFALGRDQQPRVEMQARGRQANNDRNQKSTPIGKEKRLRGKPFHNEKTPGLIAK
jgi:hypothetical protein